MGYEHMDIKDGYISDTLLWLMRDKLSSPQTGYVMFSSSGWEENVEYLLEEMGLYEEDIYLVRYGDYISCWIPREHSPYDLDKEE